MKVSYGNWICPDEHTERHVCFYSCQFLQRANTLQGFQLSPRLHHHATIIKVRLIKPDVMLALMDYLQCVACFKSQVSVISFWYCCKMNWDLWLPERWENIFRNLRLYGLSWRMVSCEVKMAETVLTGKTTVPVVYSTAFIRCQQSTLLSFNHDHCPSLTLKLH